MKDVEQARKALFVEQQRQTQYKVAMSGGQKALENGKYDEAFKFFSEALELMPKDLLAQLALHEIQEAQKRAVLKNVTLLALNTNPAQFDGQTITVGCKLSGKAFEDGGRYRLTLKGIKTIASGETIRTEGMNFIVGKAKKGQLMAGLEPDQFYRVRLTVTVGEKAKGHWFAVVSKVERVVTVDELNRDPSKYRGETVLVFGKLSRTAAPSDDKQRSRLYVKGEMAIIDASRMQQDGINFVLPRSKQFLLDGFTESFFPAKLTVTVNQGIRGNWLATVSAIEKTGP